MGYAGTRLWGSLIFSFYVCKYCILWLDFAPIDLCFSGWLIWADFWCGVVNDLDFVVVISGCFALSVFMYLIFCVWFGLLLCSFVTILFVEMVVPVLLYRCLWGV